MLIILCLLLLYYEIHMQKEGSVGKALATSLMTWSPRKPRCRSLPSVIPRHAYRKMRCRHRTTSWPSTAIHSKRDLSQARMQGKDWLPRLLSDLHIPKPCQTYTHTQHVRHTYVHTCVLESTHMHTHF